MRRRQTSGANPPPLDRMIEKARRLLERGRVERLDGGRFNVIGDHGTYAVAIAPDGRVACTCLGFSQKGRCSHSTAVIMLQARLGRGTRRPSV